ncbi:UNVERIFIED_CONTAM: hypothetical protein FKN15_047029 [Acipenser sinensis]
MEVNQTPCCPRPLPLPPLLLLLYSPLLNSPIFNLLSNHPPATPGNYSLPSYPSSTLPPHPPSSISSDDFASSPLKSDIRKLFNTSPSPPPLPTPTPTPSVSPTNSPSFSSFTPPSDSDLFSLLQGHKPTNPLPTHLFQAAAPTLLPFISSYIFAL